MFISPLTNETLYIFCVILAQKMDAYHDGKSRPAARIDKRRQPQRSTGDVQVKEIFLGSTDTSLRKVSSLGLVSSASAIVEQQNRQRTDHPSKPVPKSTVKDTGVSVAKSHSLSRISIGVCCHFPHVF